jgi:aminoglycoside phosphotransferase (APT) family kinase protein
VQGVTIIDDGFDFKVVIIDAWVVRIPRREGVLNAFETELALLPALAEALPVEVPRFEHVSHEPPFVVYRLIRGTPLIDEDADGVRAFLDALHAFDASDLPVERPDWITLYRDQCAEFERLVVPLLDVDERGRAAALFAQTETLTGFVPSLVHADLGPEHLLVCDKRLAGVIDWGDVRIGDPALDYAWLLNGPFANWDVDNELRHRARVYHQLAPWFEAHYGVFTARSERIRTGLTGIRSRLP